MTHQPDPLFENLAPPDPSPELRQRTLAVAREALGRAESSDIWTRVWNSRSAHLAWAASIGVLVFGHLVVGDALRSGSASPALPLAAAAGANDELAEVVDLGRLTAQLPGWEMTVRTTPTQPSQPAESEDRS